MLAVEGASSQCTDILISCTSQVDLSDANGRTALHRASCRGLEECVTSLLEAKASPCRKDCLGKTPLHLAASAGHVYVLKQLIEQCIPLDASTLQDSQNYTPLHWAAYKGKLMNIYFYLNSSSYVSQIYSLLVLYFMSKRVTGHENCVEALLGWLHPEFTSVGNQFSPLHCAV